MFVLCQVEKLAGTTSFSDELVEVDRREVISGSQSPPDWFKGIQGPVGPPGQAGVPVSGSFSEGLPLKIQIEKVKVKVKASQSPLTTLEVGQKHPQKHGV